MPEVPEWRFGELDWDAGTENAYEAHRERIRAYGDLCAVCKDDLVAEGEEMCHGCLAEFLIEAETETS